MRFAASIAIALLPGAVAWWWSRSIVQARGDGAAAERLAAHRVRVGWVAGLVAVGIGLVGARGSWALCAVVVLASIAGYFPARRAVLRERWGLPGYLGFLGAMGIGFFAGTALLMLVPALVPAPGPDRWGVLAVIGGALLSWAGLRQPVAERLLGGRSLDRPGLAERCRVIAERAEIPMPRLLQGGPRDGCWPQTVCWAESKRSTVLFSRTLLAELDDEELAAMFALDVAFIEHARHVDDRLGLAEVGLIAAAVAVVPLCEQLGGQAASAVSFVWPVAVIATQLAMARRTLPPRRDERAAQLVGDVEALARALTKQSALGATPRRGLPGAESAGTAAPLGRRISALRAGNEQAAPYRAPLAQPGRLDVLPRLVRGAVDGQWVLLEDERVHWLDGVPGETAPELPELLRSARSTNTHQYAALSGLALTFGDRGPLLIAADRAGKRWEQPIAEGDVGSLQAALDAVEERLGAGSAAPVTSALALGPIAILIATFAVWIYVRGPVALAVPLAVALLLRPSAASAGAIGGAALVEASRRILELAGLFSSASMPEVFRRGDPGPGAPAALSLLALLCFSWARRRAAEPDNGGKGRVRWVLVPVAALCCATVAAIAYTSPGAEILSPAVIGAMALGGLAGATLWPARRRALAVLWAAGAVACLLFPELAEPGVPGVDDLELPSIVEKGALGAPVLGRVPIGSFANELRLSPSGARFAVAGRGWRVFDRDGSRRPVEADELEFLDDDTILVLHTNDEGASARLLSAADPGAPATWERTFPGEDGAGVHVAPGTRNATIVTRAERTTQWVMRTAVLPTAAFAEERWTRRSMPRAIQELVTNGRVALEVDRVFSATPGDSPHRDRGSVVSVRSGVAARLLSGSSSIACSPGSAEASPFLCWSAGHRQSVLWQVDGDGAVARPIGAVSGHVASAALTPDGRIVLSRGRDLLVVRSVGGAMQAARLGRLASSASPWTVRVSGEVAGVIEHAQQGQTFVRIIQLPAAAAPPGPR